MLPLATDWTTVSAMVTGAGTLVLAIATFASVRSSNRSARIAEAALQEQRRPLLVPSRFEDPAQKIMFVDQHWVRATGGHAAAECIDGNVYLAASLRNVGSGMGVCQGWTIDAGLMYSGTAPDPRAGGGVPHPDAGPVRTRGRHRHVAGSPSPPRRRRTVGGRGGDRGSRTADARTPLQRPDRPAADDHPLRAHADGRLMAAERDQALVPRLGRAQARAGRRRGRRDRDPRSRGP